MRFRVVWPVLVVLMPLLAHGGEKPTLAVEPLENRGSPLTPSEMDAITDYLPTKLGEGGNMRMLPRREIRQRLMETKKRKKKKKKAKPISADYVFSGAISKLGRQCIVTVTLWEAKSRLGVRAAWARSACDADRILAAVENVVVKLNKFIPEGKMQPGAPVAVFFIENRGSPLSTSGIEAATRYLSARLVGGGAVSRVPDKAAARMLSRYRGGKKKVTARYKVSTTLAKVGAKCLLTARLYDFEKAANATTASAKMNCDADSVIEGIGQIADKFSTAVKKL